MIEGSTPTGRKQQLCWECSKATNKDGECPWSAAGIPVPGWEAYPTHNKDTKTFVVVNCPLFDRDAYDNGLRRVRKEK